MQDEQDIPAMRDSACVSAIVVSYYTGPVLQRSLAALQAQPAVAEIILVDNGNLPGEADAAVAGASGSAPIRYYSGHGNIGFAAACNLGAEKARGEFLLCINPDAIMPAGGVERLLSDGADLPRPWMMGAKLVGPDGIEQQGSRRETLTPWRAFVEATKLYRLAPRHPYFRRFNMHAGPCPDHICPVPVISGACFFLPRADYEAAGGMDERYVLHVEDIDFCVRFGKAGGGVYFNPNVSVLHYKSSSRANPVRIEARKTSGLIRYFRTHFSDAYPAPFLWLVAAALWASFGVLAAKRAGGRLLRLFGLRRRAGAAGARRAKALAARRDAR